jgi:hypothetical protein
LLKKKLNDACDTSPWSEPKPEPSNIVQDSANLRWRSSGNNRSGRNAEIGPLEIQTPCPLPKHAEPMQKWNSKMHFSDSEGASQGSCLCTQLLGLGASAFPGMCVKISRIRDWLDEAHNLLMLLWLFPSVCFDESVTRYEVDQ